MGMQYAVCSVLYPRCIFFIFIFIFIFDERSEID